MTDIQLSITATGPVTLDVTVHGKTLHETIWPVPAVPVVTVIHDLVDCIRLTWDEVPYTTGYIIWRDSAWLAAVTQPEYEDRSAAIGVEYTYRVAATNANHVGEASAPVMGLVPFPPSDAVVTLGDVLRTSALRVGIVHADNALMWGDPTAVARAQGLVGSAVSLQKTFIQGWGPGRIWPYDGSPTGTLPSDPRTIHFASLDKQMAVLHGIGAPILIACFMLPWWMRQRLDGTYLTPQDEYSEQGRLRTDCVQQWGMLVQRVAMRYMIAPYHVREFEVGAEPKGFYARRDGKTQSWEWDDYPGTPGKADMGWTAFYKYTVGAIHRAADELSIPHEHLKFWAPYSTTPSRVYPSADLPAAGHPLRDRPWGYMTKPATEFISKFLDLYQAQHFPLTGLMVDGGTDNRDNVPMDVWVAMQKLTDIMAWLHSETARIGVPDLPIAWGEFYPNSQNEGTEEYRAFLRAEGMRLMTEAGIDYLMAWQAQGPVPGPCAQLYSDPKVGGGVLKPQLQPLVDFHTHFEAGTPLYGVTVSNADIAALASDKVVYLANHAAQERTVRVGRQVFAVPPQEYRIVEVGL